MNQEDNFAAIQSLRFWIIALAHAKLIYGHTLFICELISKILVAHFKTNLVLTILKEVNYLLLNKLKMTPENPLSEVRNHTLGKVSVGLFWI